MADSKDSKKSMDIHDPSDVKPTSSSRPIIVTNRSLMQDPMVKKGTDEENIEADMEQEKPEVKNPSEAKKVIQPTSTSAEPSTDEKDEDSSKSETLAVEEKSENTDDKQEEKVETKEDSSNDAAVINAVVGSARKEGPQDEATADAKRKQNAEVLIGSKKYNVPIGQVTKAKQNRQLVLLSFLVLVLAIAYLMIDAGLAKVPFKLPYTFFNSSSVVEPAPVVSQQDAQQVDEPTELEPAKEKTYKEENDLFSLEYPTDWTVNENTDNGLTLTFHPSSEQPSSSADRLMLISGSEQYADKQVGTLEYIQSTKVSEDNSLFLIERVYKIPYAIGGESFYVSASLEPLDSTEEVGQEVSRSAEDITVGDKPASYVALFYSNSNASDSASGEGYETAEEAKSILSSDEYKVIKQIMLSFKN